ncbi:hypothetical protein ERO13_D11G116866v2 [Gossypium hirsutum]|uniref:Uncharacterized protein n=2 Tax=Gossypium TaxID=3633 RepID=A0A5J5PCA3_GOSBA|nr:hypothetical protein ES319_D11G122300v1 [Gossypium barbadense]KAG4120021.1 hypothetical protein ERO13_D11G116866v2 [Gossypium hirsutum]TYG44868.1 hypothetical protein ES288_D11G129300v1 [Gossypium darwinii]
MDLNVNDLNEELLNKQLKPLPFHLEIKEEKKQRTSLESLVAAALHQIKVDSPLFFSHGLDLQEPKVKPYENLDSPPSIIRSALFFHVSFPSNGVPSSSFPCSSVDYQVFNFN